MTENANERLDECRLDRIDSDLFQIKVLLAVIIVLVLLVLCGPAAILEAVGTFLFYGAVLLAVAYLFLLVLGKILNWKRKPDADRKLEQKILQEFESEIGKKS